MHLIAGIWVTLKRCDNDERGSMILSGFSFQLDVRLFFNFFNMEILTCWMMKSYIEIATSTQAVKK